MGNEAGVDEILRNNKYSNSIGDGVYDDDDGVQHETFLYINFSKQFRVYPAYTLFKWNFCEKGKKL